LPFEVKVEEAILTGKIDLLYRLAGRGWVVVDYKTGGRGSQPANRLQVALYAYAVAEIVGEPPERVVLLFSSGGAPYDQPVTADMLQEAQGTAMKLIDGIQVGRFESAVTSACQWCDYRETACDPRVVMPDHPK
jgi:RecB family exonuclease